MVFVFVWLTSLSVIVSRFILVAAHGTASFWGLLSVYPETIMRLQGTPSANQGLTAR